MVVSSIPDATSAGPKRKPRTSLPKPKAATLKREAPVSADEPTLLSLGVISEKPAPWNDLEFLTDHKQDSPFGYRMSFHEAHVSDISTWKKHTPCSREGLRHAVENMSERILVWTPASPKLIPPECVEFLHESVSKRSMAAARKGILVACLNCFLVGCSGLMLRNSGEAFSSSIVLFLLAFGILPFAFGLYSMYLAKRATIAETACNALYVRWIGRAFPKSLACFVAVIVAISVLQIVFGLGDSIEAVGLVRENVRSGEFWRLLTCALLHGGFLHLLFNTVVLYGVGSAIVALSQTTVLGTVFLASALSGSVFSLLLPPEATSVGASGGILGCIGFLAVFAYFRRSLMPPGFLKNMIIWIAAIAFLGIIAHDIIDNAAHLGGLVVGVGIGILLMRNKGDQIPVRPSKTVQVIGYASWCVIAAGVFLTVTLVMACSQNRSLVASPETLSLGTVRKGSKVEATVYVNLVSASNPKRIKRAIVQLPPFLSVRDNTESFVAGNSPAGEHYEYVRCELVLQADTSATGSLRGVIDVAFGGMEIGIPVEIEILPEETGLTRVLVLDMPFGHYWRPDTPATSNPNTKGISDWLETISRANLDVSYIESNRGFSATPLSDFDVVLMGREGQAVFRDADVASRMTKFLEQGGRVIVAGNRINDPNPVNVNLFLEGHGLLVGDGATSYRGYSHDLPDSEFTNGIRNLRFSLCSPISVTETGKAEILIPNPSSPGTGLVAVSRIGKGVLVAIGQSWYDWIETKKYSGSDNSILLERLIVGSMGDPVESIRKARPASHSETVRAALNRLLTRVILRPSGGFVIIEDAQSGKFVQFAGSEEEPLLLDLPSQTLSPDEMAKAKALFAELGYAGPESYQVQESPGGPDDSEQTSFSVKFRQDVDKATELAVAILHRVYGLDGNAKLKLTEE